MTIKKRRKPVLPEKVYRLSVREAGYTSSGKKRQFARRKEAEEAVEWHRKRGDEVILFEGTVTWKQVEPGEEQQKRLV